MSDIERKSLEQVAELLQAAIEEPRERRALFLTRVCGADESLRRELESLLSHYDQAGDFLEAPPSELASEILDLDRAKLESGERIGRYVIQDVLGAGGMGEVYRAYDPTLDRKVAIKLFALHRPADGDWDQRFELEARAASALNHPNIVTIHEIGRISGLRFIVTEFIEGQTLRQRMTNALSVIEALDIAIQTAGALAAAHGAGIVHRDIKPENIMLRPDGLVKVLDFGLAKVNDAPLLGTGASATELALVRTLPGTLVGTARYMSPEQARGHDVDARSDIWSLGVVLYEMLAGRTPFPGATMSDVLAAVLRDDPLPLANLQESLQADLERIEGRALAKALDRRYTSVKEMLQDLRQVEQRMRTPVDTAAPSSAARPGAMMSRRGAIWLGAAAVAAGTGLTVRWLWPPGLQKLAVAPFLNKRSDPDAERICAFVTSGLINSLGESPWIDVVPPGTLASIGSSSPDPRDVGRRLGASFLLTGEVELDSGQPIIHASLYEATYGRELWRDSFNGDNTHEQIASAIVDLDALGILTDFEREQRRALSAVSDEAWNCYWRGRRQHELATQTSFERALKWFEEAVRLDPGFALAYAAAAATWSARAMDGMVRPATAFDHHRESVENARKMDRENPGVHNELGARAFSWDKDWKTAEQEFERSIVPGHSHVIDPLYYHAYALESWATGRYAKALELAEIARRKGKRPAFDVLEANLLLSTGRIDEAIQRYKAVVRLYPGDDSASMGLEEALRIRKDFSGAIAVRRSVASRYGLDTGPLKSLFDRARTEEDYRHIVYEMANLSNRQMQTLEAAAEYVSPLDRARTFVQLGDRASALQYLSAAFDENSCGLVFLRVDPIWDTLREDSRFRAFVDRLRFPAG